MHFDLSDPASRMDETERFIEHWYGPRQPEFGLSDDILDQIPAPEPLRRLLAFAGNWNRPHQPSQWILDDQLVSILRDPAHYTPASFGPEWTQFAWGMDEGFYFHNGDSHNRVTLSESGIEAPSLELFLTRHVFRTASWNGLRPVLHGYDAHIKSEVAGTEPILDASPMENTDTDLHPEPLWLIDNGDVLVTTTDRGTSWAVRNQATADRLTEQYPPREVEPTFAHIQLRFKREQHSQWMFTVRIDGSIKLAYLSNRPAYASAPAGTIDFNHVVDSLRTAIDGHPDRETPPAAMVSLNTGSTDKWTPVEPQSVTVVVTDLARLVMVDQSDLAEHWQTETPLALTS